MARGAALGLSVTAIVFFLLFLRFVQSAMTDFATVNHPPALLNVLPWGIVALAAAVIVGMILAWRRRWWNRGARVHYTVVAVAGLAFVGFAAYWRMLGF